MAQPNVAREPSMEEILASIRRIIESNEPPTESAGNVGLPPVYGDDEIDEDEIDIVAEVAANDPGQPPRIETRETMIAQNDVEPSLSLADVAARVRAASARQADNGTVRIAPVPAMPVHPSIPEQPREVEAAPARDLPEMMIESRTVVQPASAPLVHRPGPVAERPVVQEPLERSEPVGRSEPPSLPAKVEALLSDEVGAQVARSFSELAAVFDGIENRSIEEMAEEMMRPMLQAWLDDNLPTLVERLVREEIERVARGPRR